MAFLHWRDDGDVASDQAAQTVWLHNLHIAVFYKDEVRDRAVYFGPTVNATLYLTDVVLQGRHNMLTVGDRPAFMSGVLAAGVPIVCSAPCV